MTQMTMPGIEKPPRPTVDLEMVCKGVELFFKTHPAMLSEVDSKAVVNAYSYPMDGYELAKVLAGHGYDIARDDMELFDELEGMIAGLLETAERDWCIGNDIQPPYPLSSHVTVRYGRSKVTGTLDHIYERSIACYCVKEDGCTRDGRFMIIKFEDVIGLFENVEEGEKCASQSS